MCPQFYWEMPMAELLDLVTSLVWNDRWRIDLPSLASLLTLTGWGAGGAIATAAAMIVASRTRERFTRRR